MGRVLADGALERILALSGIGQYQRWQWFADCRLVKSVILCPDKELTLSLVRCWLPQIQTVLPGCTIRYQADSTNVVFTGQAPATTRLDGL